MFYQTLVGENRNETGTECGKAAGTDYRDAS